MLVGIVVYYSFVVLRSIMDSYRLGEMWSFLDWTGTGLDFMRGSGVWVHGLCKRDTAKRYQNLESESANFESHLYRY